MPIPSICTYEQSVRLKRLGFDWPCWHWFATSDGKKFPFRCMEEGNFNQGCEVSAPTTDLAMRWLREEMQLFITVSPQVDIFKKRGYCFLVTYLPDLSVVGCSYELNDNYDTAVLKALDYAIECAVIQYRKKNQKVKLHGDGIQEQAYRRPDECQEESDTRQRISTLRTYQGDAS